MGINVLLILLGCGLYGLLHSVLAGPGFKAWAVRRLGPAARRYYRLFFNLQAIVTFLPVLFLAWRLPDAPLYRIPFPWTLLTLGLQGLGALGLWIGVSQTGATQFLGLDALLPEQEARHAHLVTGGLYRWVRHPLYTSGFLLLWLAPVMTWNLFALALGLTAYILVGIHYEERKLVREFGDAYREYRRATPMLIPLSFLRRHDQRAA